MGRDNRRKGNESQARKRGGCGRSLLLLLLAVVAVGAAAEFGARWFLADRAEARASESLGAPVTVSFGGGLLLWDVVSTRSVGTVHVTSPGSDTVPQIDVTAHTVRLMDGGLTAATADGTATLDGDQLTAAAAAGNPTENSPLAGATEVRSVTPEPGNGLLSADIGGIVRVGVSPGVSNGALTLTPEQTTILGVSLPAGLFSGITATVDSAVASLPEGVSIEGARVTESGLEVSLGGRDVVIREN